MSKTIEIKRKTERFRGNQMVFNKIKQGAYQLHMGEADAREKRTSMYKNKFGDEIAEFIERVDKEESLELSDSEKRFNARHLKSQIDEGREKLTLRFHGKNNFGI
jgi:hypothetical protein